MLAPGVQEIIDLYAAITAGESDGSPDAIRRMDSDIRSALHDRTSAHNAADLTGIHGLTVQQVHIPSPAGPLSARLYRPARQQSRATLVFWHGGGWVCGSPMTVDALCRRLASGSGTTVLNASYRLAPEFSFPHALNDAATAVAWAKIHAETWVGDGSIVVGGESAGGNLAAALCMMLRDTADTSIVAQLLLYPALSPRLTTPSAKENATGFELTTEAARYFWRCYLGEAAETPALAAPLDATDYGDLPPALIGAAEFDPLRDDATRYADLLTRAGVPVSLHVFKGLIHGFGRWPGHVPDAAQAVDEMSKALTTTLAAP